MSTPEPAYRDDLIDVARAYENKLAYARAKEASRGDDSYTTAIETVRRETGASAGLVRRYAYVCDTYLSFRPRTTEPDGTVKSSNSVEVDGLTYRIERNEFSEGVAAAEYFVSRQLEPFTVRTALRLYRDGTKQPAAEREFYVDGQLVDVQTLNDRTLATEFSPVLEGLASLVAS